MEYSIQYTGCTIQEPAWYYQCHSLSVQSFEIGLSQLLSVLGAVFRHLMPETDMLVPFVVVLPVGPLL